MNFLRKGRCAAAGTPPAYPLRVIRLGLWLLQRERASGEWHVLLLALIIGVGSVATTGFLGEIGRAHV